MYAILDSGTTTSGTVQDLVSIPAGGTLADAKGITAAQRAVCIPIPSGVPVRVGWKYGSGAFTPPPSPTPPAPTLAQQAAAALAAGLTITSTSTPTLDGTYPLSDAMQANLVALEGYYQKFSTFPNGSATVSLKDTSGTVHSFTYTQFEALFQKLGDVRAALIDCVDGISTTLPSASVTIP